MALRPCQLDHLVVTAQTLDAGVEWVEAALGVAPQVGGEHGRMGTHNAVLRLGETTYLEVIASNPGAPSPGRPRWFELDQMSDAPKLATWVARTEDLGATTSACSAEFGLIERMSRGSLEWLITIPPDGRLVGDGAVPMLIEWLVDEHAAARIGDTGCSLLGLTIFHPRSSWVKAVLDCLGLGPAAITKKLPADERPYLVADIETPLGQRSIGGPSK